MSEQKRIGNPNIAELGKKYHFTSETRPTNNSRKGSPNWATLFKRYLNQDATITKPNGEKIKIKAKDAIVIKVLENAMKTGDVATVKMMMDRMDGLPKAVVEQINKQPLQIEYVGQSQEELKEEDNFETNIDKKPE